MAEAARNTNISTDSSRLKKTNAVSFPRSGHHLLVNCLTKYFSGNLSFENTHGTESTNQIIHANNLHYCDYYKHCRQVPCSDEQVNFQKNHDFGLFVAHEQKQFKLNQEEFKKDNRKNYIIQYRELPVDSAVSEYNRRIENASFFKAKINDSPDFFSAFNSDFLEYWRRFINKWVLNPPKNAIVFSYEDLISDPFATLSRVITFLSDDEIDVAWLKQVISTMDISKKHSIQHFKYFDPYLSELNLKAHKNLQYKLKNARTENPGKYLDIKKEPISLMKAQENKDISLEENKSSTALYEKSLIYEKAIESLEESLNSKIDIIRLQQDKLDLLRNQLDLVKTEKNTLENQWNSRSFADNETKVQLASIKTKLEQALEEKNAIEEKSRKLQEELSTLKNTKSEAEQDKLSLEKALEASNQKLDSLESSKQQKNRDYESLREQYDTLEAKYVELKEKSQNNAIDAGEIKKYKKKLKKLKTELKKNKALKKQSNKYKSKLKKAESRILEINTQLQKNQAEIQGLNSSRLEREEIIRSLEGRLLESQSELELKMRDLDKLKKENESQQQNFTRVQQQNSDIRNEQVKNLTRLNNQVTALENYLEASRRELEESKSKTENALSQLKERNASLENLKNINSDLEARLNERSEITRSLEKSLAELNDEISAKEALRQEEQKKSENLRSRLEAEQNSNTQLNQRINTLESKLEVQELEKKRKQEHIFTLENYLEKEKKEKEFIQDNLRNQALEYLRKLDSTSHDLKNRKIASEQLTQRVGSLEEQLEASSREIVSLRQAYEQALGEKSELLQSFVTQIGEIENLNNQLDSLEEDKLAAEDESRDLKSRIMTLQDSKNLLIRKNKIYEQSLDNLDKHYRSSLSENKSLHEAIRELELKNEVLAQLKDELSSKKIALLNTKHFLEDLLDVNSLDLYTRSKEMNRLRAQIKEKEFDFDAVQNHVINLNSEILKIKNSYSWKIGYRFTRIIYRFFRWVPFIRKRL